MNTIQKALADAEKKLIECAVTEEGEFGVGRTEAELEALSAWPAEVYACRAALKLLETGCKLVPLEPTPEMLLAGKDAQNLACYQKPQPTGQEWAGVYYRAMLDAAPHG